MAGKPILSGDEILTANRIAKACKAGKVCALLGDGLSVEAEAVHYRDISRGVWSGERARVQPFTSPQHEALVLDWFAWRAKLLHRFAMISGYASVVWLEAQLQMHVATDCIDGFAGRAGMRDLLELYGNAQRARCHRCKIAHYPFDAASRHCPACGAGTVWPDVTMFGHDMHAKVRDRWADYLLEASLLIRIGNPVFPLAEGVRVHFVDVSPGALQLTMHSRSARLNARALHQFLDKWMSDHNIVIEGFQSQYGDDTRASPTHYSLLALCRLLQAAPLD